MLHQIITVHLYKEKKDWDDNPLWQITYLLTEWEDQMGKYLAWGHEVASKVCAPWLRTKYFPIQSEQTQSMSTLSYDHEMLKIWQILF